MVKSKLKNSNLTVIWLSHPFWGGLEKAPQARGDHKMDYKIVIGTKEGKSFQREIKSPEADSLHRKKIGDTISGEGMGLPGYVFEITGGSDKCGFPMRKGIQSPRKKVMIGESVGFSGNKRFLNKKKNPRKQKGLFKKRTVCGEEVTGIIHQVNLKVVKVGSVPLGGESAPEGEKKEEIKEKKKE